MQTFEEQYTAWIDGKLTGAELEAFERELADRPAAEADRVDAHRLGSLLRRHAVAPPLTGGEFFNHQLFERLAVDECPARPARRFSLFSLPHLAWAAAFCLLLSYTIYHTANPSAPAPTFAKNEPPASTPSIKSIASIPSTEDARILETHTEDPTIYATSVHSEKDGITVVWLDGLDYLPASYQLQ